MRGCRAQENRLHALISTPEELDRAGLFRRMPRGKFVMDSVACNRAAKPYALQSGSYYSVLLVLKTGLRGLRRWAAHDAAFSMSSLFERREAGTTGTAERADDCTSRGRAGPLSPIPARNYGDCLGEIKLIPSHRTPAARRRRRRSRGTTRWPRPPESTPLMKQAESRPIRKGEGNE